MRVCNIKKGFLWPLSILVVFTLILSGCGTSKNKTTGTSPTTVLSRPHPPVRTGDINTDTKILEVTQSVDTSGGMVVVSKPGDPLDGLVIDVPSAAYSGNTTFSVSSAPITSQTFGSDITPVSPMIYVDDGGTYSNELMYIRVPVQVPSGDFAMGFIYDAATKQLEGMPLISTDSDSVTVGTMHFSNFFISTISKSLLNNNIDSGFRPGIDDWQFTNYGSYIAPDGHCEGQSLTALWYYYTQPDGKDLCLYGRYDNNGNQPATPSLWQDDSRGYRFCSVVQKDISTAVQNDISSSSFANDLWMNLGGKKWVQENNRWKIVDVPGIGDEATWDLFAYSMEATQEPQLVCIWSKDDGGHVMICYRIKDGNLYIADPNYPNPPDNTERRIEYKDGKFTPYKLGDQAFETIQYYAKSTVVPWDQIAQHWAEFKDGTIGDDVFPAYTLYYQDANGKLQELKDGYVSSSNKIWIVADFGKDVGVTSIYRDGGLLPKDAKFNIDLNPGDNKLGIYVQKEVGNAFKYVDFQYINVLYNGLTIDPPILNGDVNKDYTFTAKTDSPPPAQTKYEWSVNGKQVQSSANDKLTTKFPNEDTYTVSVKQLDGTGRELQSAEATANIKKAVAAPAGIGDTRFVRFWTKVDNSGGNDYGFGVSNIPITWNGSTFSGNYSGPSLAPGNTTAVSQISGTVSADGKTIVKLSYSDQTTWDEKTTVDNNVEYKDLPQYGVNKMGLGPSYLFMLSGADIGTHVVSVNLKGSSDWVWGSGGIQVNFTVDKQ